MGYLIQKDYNLPIQDAQLLQINSNDSDIQATAEAWAQARIISHLTQKYDVDDEFRNTTAFNVLTTYKGNDLVVYNDLLYFITPPSQVYSFNTYYETNTTVFYKNSTYTSIYRHKGVTPDNPTLGLQYWGIGTPYSVTAGTLPTDATKWTKGDNRSAEIVQCMIDLALFRMFQRIAPLRIQQNRKDNYNESMQWLKDCAEGALTLDFPLKQTKQGFRIRFNSSPKNPNTY